MAFCQIEDLTGTGELTLFPELYSTIRNNLELDQPLLCTAKISQDKEENGAEAQQQVKLVAQHIQLLTSASIPEDQPYQLEVPARSVSPEHWTRLKDIIHRHPGRNPVQLLITMDDALCCLQLGPNFCILPGASLRQEIQQWQKELHSVH